MKYLIALAIFALPGALAADDCRWAGGSFHAEKINFDAHFTVNADCTEMVFESSGNFGIQKQDVPQTFALTKEKQGWVADIDGVAATLAQNGNFVNFIGKGVNTRVQTRPVQ